MRPVSPRKSDTLAGVADFLLRCSVNMSVTSFALRSKKDACLGIPPKQASLLDR